MLKTSKLCRVCQAVENNPNLLNQIYNSSYFMKNSAVSLFDLAKQNKDKFSYDAIRNHVKKHQFMDDADFTKRHLNKIAKKAEANLIRKSIESRVVWDEVISEGMDRLAAGELPMKAGDLLKAAKDKSDYDFKVKDQQLAMMDMVMHFASGENNESKSYDRRIIEGKTVTDYDPAEGITADSNPGPNRPSGIHYPPSWDASPSGSN